MNEETESIIKLYWDTTSHYNYLQTMGLYETAAILEATLSARTYEFILSSVGGKK